jgi:hypothetical protein
MKSIFNLKFKPNKFHYSKELELSALKIPEDDIIQVLNIENSYDFRKTKLDSIISSIQNELLEEKKKVEKLTVDLLRSRGKLNVKGALDYCGEKILGSEEYFRLEEQDDNEFKDLENNIDFMKILKEKSENNKIRETDVVHCLGGLFDKAPKEVHRSDFGAIEIDKKSWSENEIIALDSIFTLCRYFVLDESGQPIDPYPCC